MIPSHTPTLVSHKAPHRQEVMNALLLVSNHRLYHIGVATGLEQSEQRMFCTVGVPKREDGIVGEAIGLMYVSVESAILAVYIHVDRGVDHGVVERGVKHGHLV